MSLFAHKRIVTIGAGTGHRALLTGLVAHRDELASLTAIVAVTDNGGHSGELRQQHAIPAVGDGRQCLTALATDMAAASHFDSRDSDGRSYGNMELAALVKEHGSLSKAFEIAGKKLHCAGTVVPATDTPVHIAADLVDGTSVVGEWQMVERQPVIPIERVYLDVPAPAHPQAIAAIKAADVIIIASGGFYVGVVSTLLPDGMAEAIRQSKAQLIQIVNFYNFPGMTDGWSVEHHLNEMEKYATRRPDVALVNNGPIPKHVQDHYHERQYNEVVPPADITTIAGTQLVVTDLVPTEINGKERPGNFKKATHLLVHDPQKTVEAVGNALRGQAA